MKRDRQRDLDASATAGKAELLISLNQGTSLSSAQMEFNRLMTRLEEARTKHEKTRSDLDQVLAISIRDLMPLVEDLNRVGCDIVIRSVCLLDTIKLTPKRRKWFIDRISGQVGDLLADPVGLGDEEIGHLEGIQELLGPCEADKRVAEEQRAELDFLRTMTELAAKEQGVDLDLSDLDVHGDPAEFVRNVSERLKHLPVALGLSDSLATKRRKKPSKAQLEKERKRVEREEAKTRDFKSLFKQLAKAFHPDLESDPGLRAHKEIWMKRLNQAYESRDLREMLQLELEWLGEEATNLATASDEKLKVYGTVLREQISDLKQQTDLLPFDSIYTPLQRFMDPVFGVMDPPSTLKRKLEENLREDQETLELLDRDDVGTRKRIQRWADDHARSFTPSDCRD